MNELFIDMFNDLFEAPENYTAWKQPIPKSYTLYDFMCVTVLK